MERTSFPRLLTSSEVMDRLRISYRTLNQRIADGDIRVYRTKPGGSGRRLFREDDVLALFHAMEQPQ